MRILHFGSFDARAWRNRIVRDALLAAGAKLETVHVEVWRDTRAKLGAVRSPLGALAALRRQRAAWRQLRSLHDDAADYDLMLVGSTAHLDLPLARKLSDSRGKPLVFDPLISISETLRDRGLWRLGAMDPRQRVAMAMESRLMRLPDRILVDTHAHATAWAEELGITPTKTIRFPAGAPELFRETVTDYSPESSDAGPLRVLYCGQFIPLHGLITVVEAAARLQHRPDIRFDLVGRGQELPAVRDRAESLGLSNLHIEETWMPEEELARRWLEPADLCLGLFGSQAKAQRVLPFKVFAALAAGRAVVTADTPALKELLEPEEAWAVPAEDPEELADAVATLADRPELRLHWARAGRMRWDRDFGLERVGLELMVALERVVAQGRDRG